MQKSFFCPGVTSPSGGDEGLGSYFDDEKAAAGYLKAIAFDAQNASWNQATAMQLLMRAGIAPEEMVPTIWSALSQTVRTWGCSMSVNVMHMLAQADIDWRNTLLRLKVQEEIDAQIGTRVGVEVLIEGGLAPIM